MPEYTHDDRRAFMHALNVVAVRWRYAIHNATYSTAMAQKVLCRLWLLGSMKTTEAGGLIAECVKSPNIRRDWMRKAIADGVIESDDIELDRALRSGKKPPPRQGKKSPTIRLTDNAKADIEKFLDAALEEMVLTLQKVET